MVGWPGAAQDHLPAHALDFWPGYPDVPRDQAKNAGLLVLQHEKAVLRRNAGRVRYEPADRAWFTALTRFIPRRRWTGVFPVTPATLLAWHRRLAARRYDTSKRRPPSRPATVRSIARLAVRLAKENPLWDTGVFMASSSSRPRRSRRRLSMRSCAFRVSIRHRAGTARRGGSSCTRTRPGSWPSTSFTSNTILLNRLYALIFIEHDTHRMHLGGVTAHPAGDWTVQQARNLAMNLAERSGDFRFLIRDRGSNFTRSFDAVFQGGGTTILRTAVQAPRMNAICERLAGTLRRELLDRSLILGEAHLRAALAEYQEHYNTARPHQGIG
jgi:putative transposase